MCQGTVVSRQLEFISDRGRQDRGHRLAPVGPPDPLRQTDAYALTLARINVCSHTCPSEGRGVGSGSAVLLTNRIHPNRAESRPLLEPVNTTERVYAWLYLVLGGTAGLLTRAANLRYTRDVGIKLYIIVLLWICPRNKAERLISRSVSPLKRKNKSKQKKKKTPHVCSITKP